jgi:hypothetical protein
MIRLRALYRSLVVSGTLNTIYVSASSGSDTTGNGSVGNPYASIQKAVNGAAAGSRILVDASGTYAYTDVYGVTGNALNWVSIESLDDSIRPVIDVSAANSPGIEFQLSSFCGLFGFEIKGLQTSANVNDSGVNIFRASHHIVIWNNVVHDFPSGGIQCFYTTGPPVGAWDLVDVSFNTVYNTSKYNPANTSGISFFSGADITNTTWDGRYGYRCVGNYVYNVICTVNNPSGGNIVTDGNGITSDSCYQTNAGGNVYSKYGLFEGNLVTGCGAKGMHVVNSINVDDFYGTYVGNLITVAVGITNTFETDARYIPSIGVSNNVNHVGCVILPLNSPNTTDAVSTYTNCVIAGGTQAVPGGNVDRHSIGAAYLAGIPTTTTVLAAQPSWYYTPVAADTATNPAHGQGRQVLLNGFRAPSSTGLWVAGAIEPNLPVMVLV